MSEDLLYRELTLTDAPWQRIGDAFRVVAMTSAGGKLYAVTSEDKLWVREPDLLDVPWKYIGQAQHNVVALAGTTDKLFCVTREGILWERGLKERITGPSQPTSRRPTSEAS